MIQEALGLLLGILNIFFYIRVAQNKCDKFTFTYARIMLILTVLIIVIASIIIIAQPKAITFEDKIN